MGETIVLVMFLKSYVLMGNTVTEVESATKVSYFLDREVCEERAQEIAENNKMTKFESAKFDGIACLDEKQWLDMDLVKNAVRYNKRLRGDKAPKTLSNKDARKNGV